MDLKTLESRFIKYFKETPPRKRLERRNSLDPRLTSENLYVEIHHIIPVSVGGNDDPDNLVIVLPEEHLFLHKLRFKIYGCREDMLAVRFILNGLSTKSHLEDSRKSMKLTKSILQGYAYIKANSSEFRKKYGWQTVDGRKRISKYRTGLIPVKNSLTGEIIGEASIIDPRVVSGEWVHTSKGRKMSPSELEKRKFNSRGENNPRHLGVSDETLVEEALKLFHTLGRIPSFAEISRYCKLNGVPCPTHSKGRFSGKGMRGLILRLEEITGMKYTLPPRNSSNYKHKYKSCWVTNGRATLKIKEEELEKYLTQGYRKGRTLVSKN